MDIETKLQQQYEFAMKDLDKRDEENEELENRIKDLEGRLQNVAATEPDIQRRERIKAQVLSELARLQELQSNMSYKYDPSKLRVHVLPPRSKPLEKEEDIEFRLIHPELLDFTLVGIEDRGCDTQLYQQLQYPMFNDDSTTEEFNEKLNNTVFQTPVIPFEGGMLSVYQYKQMLDEKIKEGHSTCGSVETSDKRDIKCQDTQVENASSEKYKYFSVPQMMLPLYFNPHTSSTPLTYPDMLLYHGVGAGKTCTAIKLFNNFRCEPYKKIWVTNPNLEAQLLSGAVGKADINSCWDDRTDSDKSKVFVSKEYVEKHELGVDQILVLTYTKFAEIFYRGSSKEGRLYRNSFPSFWTRSNEKEPLDPRTYRYNIFDPLLDSKGRPIIKHGQKVQGPRAGKRTIDWENLKGSNSDFDPLENAIIIIDEAHQLETVQGSQIRVVKNAIRDSKENPNGKGVKLVLMTATPITDDPMTAVKLLNFLLPQNKARFPEGKDEFTNAFWKDDMSRMRFINAIKGLVSYYDPSTNITGFAQAIPGELVIPKTEQRNNLLYEKGRKYGIIKLAFNEKETQSIIKSCNVQPLDFLKLREMTDPIALLKSIPKLTFEKLCLMYGVSMNRSSNPEQFIDEVFNKDFKRSNSEIIVMIINKLRAMVYECINDLDVTGEPPTRYDKGGKGERIKEFRSDNVKVKVLAEQIGNLDEMDMKVNGHLNKHMIYSSGRLFKTKNMNEWPTVPVRLMSALANQDKVKFNTIASIKEIYEKVLAPANLTLERKSNGSLVLCKKDKSSPVRLPKHGNNLFFMRNPGNKAQRDIEEATKEIFESIFNDHIYNNEGQLIRFVLLDTGFKEGISLFNIKHVHIMEPQASSGDMTQAVGRAIRFCGHKGTPYEYKVGWKVFVYLYDTWIMDKNEPGGGYTIGNKILNILGETTDFKDQLDMAIKTSAFDYTLNLPADSDELRAPIDRQATLLGSLWQRPPESFDYGKFEKKYFYKMFPKVRAIPEEEIIDTIIKPLVEAKKAGKWFWQGFKESEEIETAFTEWIMNKYYAPYFHHDQELFANFNTVFGNAKRGMPAELKLLFRDFNYQKDIVLHNDGGKVIFPVFVFKERSKIDFEKSPDLNEVRAMIEYDSANKELSVFFRDISNSSICDIHTNISEPGNLKLKNLSLWFRIPAEKINFTKDISHFVGDCKGRAPGKLNEEPVVEQREEEPLKEMDISETAEEQEEKGSEETGWLGTLANALGFTFANDEEEEELKIESNIDNDNNEDEEDVRRPSTYVEEEIIEPENIPEEEIIYEFKADSDIESESDVESDSDVEEQLFREDEPVEEEINEPIIRPLYDSKQKTDSETTDIPSNRPYVKTQRNIQGEPRRRSERLAKKK